MIFGILIPRTTKYNAISEASLLSSPKNVSMSLNIIMYLSSFQQIYFQFCFDFYTFIFWLFSSDTLQVIMFVCTTVSELRFYRCCHPCLFKFYLIFYNASNSNKVFFRKIESSFWYTNLIVHFSKFLIWKNWWVKTFIKKL